MSGLSYLKTFKRLLIVITLLLNVLVYFYPDILNKSGQCNWHQFEDSTPLKRKYEITRWLPPKAEELLLLNFPSLSSGPAPIDEGDDAADVSSGSIHMLAFGDPQINGNWKSTKYVKRLDNYGNDYYLGHIYNIMSKRLKPSHVVVMGDLFSSQWILDSEFYNRTYRYVERLFPRDLEHKKTVVETHSKHQDYDWVGWMNREKALDPGHRFKTRVYNDTYDWTQLNRPIPNFDNPLFINLTGNHDIGYSGDATWQHMARFHLLFGQNNYVINYNKGKDDEWRLVVLDSLTLEGPALEPDFVSYTWSFLENLKNQENPTFKGPTVLLTHIPLFKKEGICEDGPEHRYYVDNQNEPFKNGLLRSQNHLSYETSQKVLDIVFPNDNQNGVILTGHDHVGCESWYNLDSNEWVASKEAVASRRKPVKEIVVRSMMGDYDGQTGIFTGHFDKASSKWAFQFTYCSFTVQHWWWASKICSLATLLWCSIDLLLAYI